jgi:hypothetical protein
MNVKKGEKDKGKKSVVDKSDDDVMKPPRPISAYLYYQNDNIPKIKQEQGLSQKDAMTASAALWHTLSKEERAPYDEKAEESKKQYTLT